MQIELTGVLEDGSAFAAGVPTNTRKALSLPIGEDVTLLVTVMRPTGEIVTGGLLTWTAKKLPTDSSKTFQKNKLCSAQTQFTLTPADTKKLEPGMYAFYIWHTALDGKRNAVIPLSPLHLEPAATEAAPVVTLSIQPTGLTLDLMLPGLVQVLRTINGVSTDVTASATWTGPVSPVVASVDTAGMVTAAGILGPATLTATVGGLTATLPVTVVANN